MKKIPTHISIHFLRSQYFYTLYVNLKLHKLTLLTMLFILLQVPFQTWTVLKQHREEILQTLLKLITIWESGNNLIILRQWRLRVNSVVLRTVMPLLHIHTRNCQKSLKVKNIYNFVNIQINLADYLGTFDKLVPLVTQ